MAEENILRGKVFRIRPNKEQKEFILKQLKGCRFCYNWAIKKFQENFNEVSEEIRRVEAEGGDSSELKKRLYLDGCDLGKLLTQFKKTEEGKWLKELDSAGIATVVSLQSTFNKSLKEFWKKFRNKKYKSEIEDYKKRRYRRGLKTIYPSQYKFFPQKKKWSASGSYETNGKYVKLQGNRIYLPKVGWVAVANWEEFPTKWNQKFTVSTDGWHFYVSVISEAEPKVKSTCTGEVIGIDMGLKNLCTLSDGTVIENPAKTEKAERLENLINSYKSRITKIEKAHGLYSEGGLKHSNNSRKKVNKIRTWIRKREIELDCYKKTLMKQIGAKIVSMNPKAVIFEDLSIKGMQKNKRTSKSIQKTGMGNFITVVTGQLELAGIPVYKVDKKFASTQLCSKCGYKNEEIKGVENLGVREYKCPNCGNTLDRDWNAALNLAMQYDKVVDKEKN